MRTCTFLLYGLLVACDERPPDHRVLGQQLPLADSEDISVQPADPSLDGRDALGARTAADERDLEHERATLLRVIDTRLERVDASIAALEERSGAAAQDTIAMLRAKRDQARAKSSELDEISYEGWVAYKRDVYAAWDELERDVEAAMR